MDTFMYMESWGEESQAMVIKQTRPSVYFVRQTLTGKRKEFKSFKNV